MRLVLASCEAFPRGDGDENGLLDALADVGVEARWAPWGGEVGADERVVIRACWDYTEQRDDFLRWCASVPAVCNPLAVIARNTDKRYLADFRAAGVPTVPTLVVAAGQSLPELDGEIVVKPSVGAGSRGAGRFAATDRRAAEHVEQLHQLGFTALVQPYQRAVDVEGETSLVFFRGRYSHSFTKGAMLRGGPLWAGGKLFADERLAMAQPSHLQRELAARCVAHAAADVGLSDDELVYARVDLVHDESGSPVLLEMELTEPSLGFAYADAAALGRFATALAV